MTTSKSKSENTPAYDFSDLAVWGLVEESASTAGMPLSELAGPAASWFVDKQVARNDPRAIEDPATMHAEFSAWVEKDVTAAILANVTALRAELARIERDAKAGKVSDDVRLIANQSRTAVSARLAIRCEVPTGHASASVSLKVDGATLAAVRTIVPASVPRKVTVTTEPAPGVA